ncbi:MAG: SdrD B-like domain-containing protein [Pseudomonadota bacterium]
MKQGLLHFIVKGLLASIFILNINFAAATNLARGPYLQTGTSTSVIVRWRSDEATNSRVRLGAHPTNLTMIVDDANLTTEHIVQVNGLMPNTKYFYAIGSTTERLSGGDVDTYFSTAPKTGERTAFRTWVIGDAGTGTPGQVAVYNAYRNFTGTTKTNLWLQLGDNAYPDGTDADFQANVFNVYPEMLRQSVTWPALGNHDGHSADSGSQTGPYYNMFSLPKNAEAGGVASGTEAYYSFDYANVHFIVLDSADTNRAVGAPMYRWLQADLQAAISADWIVAIWHHPPYSKGAHDSDTEVTMVEMRQNYLPLLENYGVDLVLTGHSHSYERSHFINGHYDVSTTFAAETHVKQTGSGNVENGGAYNKQTTGMPHSGTVYAVAGSSGKLKPGPLNHPAMFSSLYELGSMVLDVDGLTLSVKFINDAGGVRDDFTLTKSGSSALGRINGLAWKDSDADGIRESGEILLSNIEAQLFNASNQLMTTTFTDNAGAYRFNNLTADTYNVQVVKNAYAISPKDQGTNDTIDSDAAALDGKISAINLLAGSTVNNIDVGLFTPVTSSIAAASSKCSSSVKASLAASSKNGSSISRSSVRNSSAGNSLVASSLPRSSNSLSSISRSIPALVTVSLQEGLNGYTGASDTYVASGRPHINYGDSVAVLADGSDTLNVRLVALLKWATGSIPETKTVTAVNVQMNVFNSTTDTYDLYAMNLGWEESTAIWSNTDPVANRGALLGSFAPVTTGVYTISLNAAGIALVQSWVNGAVNNGLMIMDRDSVNGIDIRSSERETISSRPKLMITYQ